MADLSEYLDERELAWLRAVRRRSTARRVGLAGAVLLLMLGPILLASMGTPEVPRPVAVAAGPTAEQPALEDGRKALAAWGRFAVTNDLRDLRGSFWVDGPQYQLLAREARLRAQEAPLGTPAYQFALSGVRVLVPSPDQRVLRGRVQVTRPGEETQTYWWDVWMRHDAGSDGRWRLWTVARTARASGRTASHPVVVVAAGDISPAGSGWGPRATSDRVLAIRPDAVLTLGDNQYPTGSLTQFQRYYHPTWGRLKAATRPAPGNHEYMTAGAAGYFRYFGAAARPAGKSYYSFGLDSWHLISLDSQIDRHARSPQVRWLRRDLVANTKRCILAYWHFPRFTSGAYQGNNLSVGPFWDALYLARADIVLSGHEHSYERFALQDPAGRETPHGIRQFVVGTGGADLLPFGAPRPNSQVRRNDTWGVLVLTLHPTSYEWRFVSHDGVVLDQGGPVACH